MSSRKVTYPKTCRIPGHQSAFLRPFQIRLNTHWVRAAKVGGGIPILDPPKREFLRKIPVFQNPRGFPGKSFLARLACETFSPSKYFNSRLGGSDGPEYPAMENCCVAAVILLRRFPKRPSWLTWSFHLTSISHRSTARLTLFPRSPCSGYLRKLNSTF